MCDDGDVVARAKCAARRDSVICHGGDSCVGYHSYDIGGVAGEGQCPVYHGYPKRPVCCSIRFAEPFCGNSFCRGSSNVSRQLGVCDMSGLAVETREDQMQNNLQTKGG